MWSAGDAVIDPSTNVLSPTEFEALNKPEGIAAEPGAGNGLVQPVLELKNGVRHAAHVRTRCSITGFKSWNQLAD